MTDRLQDRAPPDELCACPDTPPIKLMGALNANPIHCLRCNLEVSLDALPLSDDLAEAIAAWRDVHDALERLWLASGAYESWAAAELADLDNEMNRTGLALRARLDPIRRCYYWCFRDQEVPLERCPRCAGPLVDASEQVLACQACSLALPGTRGAAVDPSLPGDLCDARPEVRQAAFERLRGSYLRCSSGHCETVSAVARAVLPALTELLIRGDAAQRADAADALAFLASDAEGVVDVLRIALEDPDAKVRSKVLDVIGEMGPAAAVLAAVVEPRVRQAASHAERAAALVALWNMGDPGSHVGLLFEALLEDDAAEVQAEAARCLAWLLENGAAEVAAEVSQRFRRLSPRPSG